MRVEDHVAFRQALAFLLTRTSALEVVAQAGSLAEAREALDGPTGAYRLDVAVIDLGLPDGDGMELVGELRRRNAGVGVVLLSETTNAERSEGASKAGAGAVLDKAQSPSTIVREVRRVGEADKSP